MQAIQNFFEHRLNFQRYNASSKLYDRHLLEHEFFRTKRFARGRTDLGIDFEDELFFLVEPLLYRVISECKNHFHHNFGYIKTSFEIFAVPDRCRTIPPRIPLEQDTCVICVTNNPNILYSSCGHMCICDSCNRMHPVNTCPLCRSGCVNKFYLRH